MSKCATTLPECAKAKGYNVVALSNGYYSNDVPANALIYDTGSCFETPRDSNQHWWAIDFGTIVTIQSYQINAAEPGWISSWKLSVSNDFSQWNPIDSQNKFPGDTMYSILTPKSGRYAQIIGASDFNPSTCFEFYYVKFFGLIGSPKSSKKVECSCHKNYGMKKNIINILLLVYSK